MKVVVFGAAGKTGKAVVKQALAADHQVTAFVQKADDYGVSGVRVVEGDATDRAAVDKAVAGQDAVIDTIGGKQPYKSTNLEANSASTLIASMQANGVRRLVVTSMIGEGSSEGNATIWERLLLSTMLRGTTKDKAAMESSVSESGLDWIIVRPAILNDDPATGNIRIFATATGEKAHKVSRTDLASFLVTQLSQNEHIQKAVTVANS